MPNAGHPPHPEGLPLSSNKRRKTDAPVPTFSEAVEHYTAPPSERPYPTDRPAQKALLLAVDFDEPGNMWKIDDSLGELERLAGTVDVVVVGTVTQKLPHPVPGTFVGSGKLKEIQHLREALHYDIIIVDADLTPAQQRNLETELGVLVIDRTALILDVFARRAQTHEGRLQVELAQLQYRLPRLTRMWTHLSRQAAGGVGLRGPGETQLEADRREAGARVSFLKKQLEQVETHRDLYRSQRRDNQAPIVALVGYTNAGKSTLLNTFTGADVLSEDKLFATLDPTTRQARFPSGRAALMTDTVGFINNLPTTLVAAFRATLEEINEASVLVHVLDVTHPNVAEQAATVNEVLEELGADDKPIVLALNKMDALGAGGLDELDPAILDALRKAVGADALANAVPISARNGYGLDTMMNVVEVTLEAEYDFVPVRVRIPFDRQELVDRFHRLARVQETAYDEHGVTLHGTLPSAFVGRFAGFIQELPRSLEGGRAGEMLPDVPMPMAAGEPASVAIAG